MNFPLLWFKQGKQRVCKQTHYYPDSNKATKIKHRLPNLHIMSLVFISTITTIEYGSTKPLNRLRKWQASKIRVWNCQFPKLQTRTKEFENRRRVPGYLCTIEKLFLESQFWNSDEFTFVSRTQCKSPAKPDTETASSEPWTEEAKESKPNAESSDKKESEWKNLWWDIADCTWRNTQLHGPFPACPFQQINNQTPYKTIYITNLYP